MRFYPVSGAGGGGVSSSDVTVTKYDVPASKTALTSDSNDEVVMGLLEERSSNYEGSNSKNDAEQRVYLAIPTRALYTTGAKLYVSFADLRSLIGLTAGNIATGSTILGAAGTYKGLGNAAVTDVRAGKTFSTGLLSNATGTLSVSSVVSFSTSVSGATVTLKWQWPSKGPYGGVIIRVKEGSYPTSVSDGSQAYKGTGSNSAISAQSTATWTAPNNNRTYYFRLWVYCDTSQGTLYSGQKDATAWIAKISGTQTFTSSGTFTVPSGVTQIQIFCVGGGGAGGVGVGHHAGYGGGAGYTKTATATVSPGQKIVVTIGAGGTPSSSYYPTRSGTGGTTSAGSLCSATGGQGGVGVDDDEEKTFPSTRAERGGGAGGSGGGGCGNSDGDRVNNGRGGKGGYDGGDGQHGTTAKGVQTTYYSYTGGKGQGTTTRKWGASGETVYSGGGSGGTRYEDHSGMDSPGAGGGKGGDVKTAGGNGSANTGGGGGGGGSYGFKSASSGKYNGGYGGSGICIIRWGW
jgi:hypothetical protein